MAESRWDRLPWGVRAAAGAGALLLPVAGIMAGISTMTVSSYPAPQFHAAPAELSPHQPAGTPAPGSSAGARPDAKSGPDRPHHPAPTGPRQEPAALAVGMTAAHDRRGPETVTGGQGVPAPKLKAAARPPAAVPAVANRPPAAVPAVANRPPAAVPAVANRPPAAAPAEPVTAAHEVPNTTGLVHDPAPLGLKPVLAPGSADHHDFRFVVTALNGQQPHRHPIGASVARPPRNRVLAADSGWHHRRFRTGMDAEQPAWSWQNDDERCDAFSLFARAAEVTDTDFDFLSGLWLTTAGPDTPLDFPAFS